MRRSTREPSATPHNWRMRARRLPAQLDSHVAAASWVACFGRLPGEETSPVTPTRQSSSPAPPITPSRSSPTLLPFITSSSLRHISPARQRSYLPNASPPRSPTSVRHSPVGSSGRRDKEPAWPRLTSASASMDKRTLVVGTPSYMAPEVVERSIYSPACDMWAVGVILYFSLRGQVLPPTPATFPIT